jgi:hypothetical protein
LDTHWVCIIYDVDHIDNSFWNVQRIWTNIVKVNGRIVGQVVCMNIEIVNDSNLQSLKFYKLEL